MLGVFGGVSLSIKLIVNGGIPADISIIKSVVPPCEIRFELAEKLFQKKIAKYFYLVCGPNNKGISKKIIELSKKEYFIDCSNLNLLEIIKIILDSKFFIGNNSGPLNLSAALNVKSYGLIANSPASQLKYSNIKIITPDAYTDNVFNKDRNEMRKLTVDKVFNSITMGMRF